MTTENPTRYCVMKRNGAYVTGWELCGTTFTKSGAEAIQEAHTTFLNGEPYNIPEIWTETQYEQWQRASLFTRFSKAGGGGVIPEINILILTDKEGGKARLTNQSQSSRHGMPVLQFIAKDIEGDFGPADLIDFTSVGGPIAPAANLVYAWAMENGRTEEERKVAGMFLRQWPDGPQLGW